MEAKCDEALEQISQQHYDAPYLDEGYTQIDSYAVCFYKKECLIKKAEKA